jgi:arylsulfatase A-like enzyme
LFIPIDDLRPQLACYGRRQMISPHIDGLAEEGVLFSRAYCQVPVCGASRASLLTGVRPTRDRFLTYYTMTDRDLPGALTLPQHFRNHGYVTLSDGKVFHHAADTAERSWSEPPWRARIGPWRNYLLKANQDMAAQEEDGRGPPYECADVPDGAYLDGMIAERAIEDLSRLKAAGSPFFLAVGFVKPHLPFNAPKRCWDYYSRSRIQLADNPFPPDQAPSQALHDWKELRDYFDMPKEGPMPDEMALNLIHGYYAATSYVDAQVGRVLGALEDLGLKQNTVVVLWGDHGWQLGEHGLWSKFANFNTSLNAPLIIRAPGLSAGRTSRALVEFIDIYPTLCELAGISLPDHLEGTSLVPLLNDPAGRTKDAAFSRYLEADSIRTDRFLYTEWTDDNGRVAARMLYDHDIDPDENRNIAETPERRDIVADLGRRLHTRARDRCSPTRPFEEA